jgi:hypothetical protein
MAGFPGSSARLLRHRSVLAFGAWNAAIWLLRIRNIVRDDELGIAARLAWSVPALVFGLGGLVALSAWWRGGAVQARVVVVVALATVLYWPVRTALIVAGDHEPGFVVVHLVLAVVSMALAVPAGRRARRAKLTPQAVYR